MEVEVEMGKDVEFLSRVAISPITPTEQVMFANRIGRRGPSHAVNHSTPTEQASIVTVILKRINPKHFHLITAWIGTLAKKEPWDLSITTTEDRKVSLEYWRKNALNHDPTVMEPIYQSTWKEELYKLNIYT